MFFTSFKSSPTVFSVYAFVLVCICVWFLVHETALVLFRSLPLALLLSLFPFHSPGIHGPHCSILWRYLVFVPFLHGDSALIFETDLFFLALCLFCKDLLNTYCIPHTIIIREKRHMVNLIFTFIGFTLTKTNNDVKRDLGCDIEWCYRARVMHSREEKSTGT